MLTSAGVREQGYEINERGTITSPGKFEGEPWFIVALWDATLDGCEGEPDGDFGYWIQVTEETAEFFEMDRDVYPIGSWLYLSENDQGFVSHAKHAHKIETVTGVGYARWASYLINGDGSGLDISNTRNDPEAGDRERAAADKFAEWLGGDIVEVSEESFLDRPDTGGLPGDCVTYTAIIREGK